MCTRKSLCFAIPVLLLFVCCSSKKDSNPLDAKNTAPTLEIIGFDSDTLTFAQEQKYTFRFKATDKEGNPLTVAAEPLNESGTVEMAGNDQDGVYTAHYTPFQDGEHVIEVTVSDKLETVQDNLVVFFLDNALPVPVIKYREINRNVADTLFTYEFDAGSSSDPGGAITRVKWNFDGTIIEGSVSNKITHNFNYYGVYNIGLTVFDEHDASDSTAISINNSLLRLSISADKTSGSFPLTVSFTAEASNDDNSAISFAWDFRDGNTSNEQNPTHTFEEGQYMVVCTASDHIGTVKDSISIKSGDDVPVASLSVSSTDIKNGDQIIFDGSNSYDGNGNLKQYHWFIKTPAAQTVKLSTTGSESYIYDVQTPVGINRAGLVVEDFTENFSDTSWVELTVQNQPPQAEFTYSKEPERVIIASNQSSDIDPGDVIAYEWYVDSAPRSEFDGNPTPVFDLSSGPHEIKLRAIDNHGEFDEKAETVDVPGKPIADFVFPRGINSYTTKNDSDVVLDATGSDEGYLGNRIDKYTWFAKYPDSTVVNLDEVSSPQYTATTAYPVGINRIGLVIRNDLGFESDTTWKNLTIENTKPTRDFWMNDRRPEWGIIDVSIPDTVYCRQDVHDPDPFDIITYEWIVNFNGSTPIMTSDLEDIAILINRFGVYDVRLKVYENGVYRATSEFGYIRGN